MPAVLFRDIPAELDRAAAMLGLAPEQLGHMRGGGLQAELDVPSGAWRYWPDRGVAAWLSRRDSATPPTGAELEPAGLGLPEAVERLHAAGLWCAEMRLYIRHEGWTPSLQLREALELLHETEAPVDGVSALWSDGRGSAARVELFAGGQAWASSPVEAERWLLVAAGLSDD
jgi:hypothetical protein